jgi:ankyrin repeat protein
MLLFIYLLFIYQAVARTTIPHEGSLTFTIDGLQEAAYDHNVARLERLLNPVCDDMPPECATRCFPCVFWRSPRLDEEPCAEIRARHKDNEKWCDHQCQPFEGCDDRFVDAFDTTGTTALHWAAAGCNDRMVLLLLNAGADVNLTNEKADFSHNVTNGLGAMAPLAAAAMHGCSGPHEPPVVERLLKAGAHVNAQSYSLGNSALLQATTGDAIARKGHSHVMEVLLRAGANPDIANHAGTTPLMAAARYGKTDQVAMLLAANATVDARKSVNDMTALMYAGVAGSTDVVQLLLDAGADAALRWGTELEPPGVSAALLAQQSSTSARHIRVAKVLAAAERKALGVSDLNPYNLVELGGHGVFLESRDATLLQMQLIEYVKTANSAGLGKADLRSVFAYVAALTAAPDKTDKHASVGSREEYMTSDRNMRSDELHKQHDIDTNRKLDLLEFRQILMGDAFAQLLVTAGFENDMVHARKILERGSLTNAGLSPDREPRRQRAAHKRKRNGGVALATSMDDEEEPELVPRGWQNTWWVGLSITLGALLMVLLGRR